MDHILQDSLAKASFVLRVLYRKDDPFSPCYLSPLMGLEIIHSSIRTPELTHFPCSCICHCFG